MNQKQMFEKSFERPSDYFDLSSRQQWSIDAALGILDWEGGNLTPEESARFQSHYKARSTQEPTRQSPKE